MQSESPFRPSAAEFPHDNPQLDCGALWMGSGLEFEIAAPVTVTLEAPFAVAVAVEVTVAEPLEGPAAEVVAYVEPEPAAEPASVAEPDPAAEPLSVTEPPTAPSDDPISIFVRAVTEVALAHGPREIAPQIESLFQLGAPADEELSPPVRDALVAGNILEPTDSGVRVTDWFANTHQAWQTILRGETGDLSACGDSTLDAWTADVVARLIASPEKAPSIRRDLRRKGIAAFGMLD